VSQYLISSVQNGPLASSDPDEVVFRTLLFKTQPSTKSVNTRRSCSDSAAPARPAGHAVVRGRLALSVLDLAQRRFHRQDQQALCRGVSRVPGER
jgi:hypothetical protein